MQNLLDKRTVHQACVNRQEELIKNFASKVEDLKKELFAHDTIPSQEDHKPSERIEILESMEKELNFLHFEMNLLGQLNPDHKYEIIQPGALVVTDIRVFYISVSIEEIEVEGQEIFGISTQAPLYKEMAGKQMGDSFAFNNTSYTIKAVY
jgi:hypothetical protein